MLILSRVCVDFRIPSGAVLFRITPSTRLTFQEAPEAIREDPLFSMLLDDGSIEVASSVVRKKALETDPMMDSDASGKRTAARKTAVKTGADAEKQLTNSPKQDIMKKQNND